MNLLLPDRSEKVYQVFGISIERNLIDTTLLIGIGKLYLKSEELVL